MRRPLAAYIIALLGVGAVALLTDRILPALGLASSALLFLLPVLFAAARGGVGPGLVAALAGAAAYNFFLLPPRYTFRIHGLENLISVQVLVVVALVTSRLATRLKAREAEALNRASRSAELAELSTLLATPPTAAAMAKAQAFMTARYGDMRLLHADDWPDEDAAFSSLDLAAAAWASHNGDATGHGTEVMPAADWTFLPLSAGRRQDGWIAALARPGDTTTRSGAELEHLRQITGLFGQCRDRAALAAEREERERLEQGDQLRRTLLAALAHDLRTPLTVVTGRLALLADDNADAAEALAAAKRLDHMMADLLNAARIEERSLEPRLESIDPVDAIGAALESTVARPGVAVTRAVPPDLPFVRGDPVLLQHILTNLVENALRHARSQVRVGTGNVADGLVLFVDDDGPGVPDAERSRIFDRFARIEGSDRSPGGSGLGLAIVKGFAEAMGMTISIASAPMGGARFALTLPLAGRRPT
jgi:two-component system sensor histidine kinase KdpD